MINHARWLTLFATLLCLPGCSVDEFRNVQRKANCEECKKAGGRCITDKFCLLEPVPDAGIKDAAVSDAARDDDANTGDAAPDEDAGPVPCNTEDQLSCHTQDEATLRQPPCQPGVRTCVDGVFGECIGEITPTEETCDGEDNDCDGSTDELPERTCTIDDPLVMGECAIGIEVCRNGAVVCQSRNGPQSDSCNGKDDDCDGKVDEQTAVVCYPEDTIGCVANESGHFECVGKCKAGIKRCVDGAYEEACVESELPSLSDQCTEDGQSSIDEDCDGEIDEGCECSEGDECYTGPASSRGKGPCHAGTWECSENSRACVGEVKPKPETCANQGVDDDCDGEVDNIPLVDTSCAAESSANGICKANARWQCVGGVLTCVPGAMGQEVCDAQNTDEDCDGMANEGFTLDTDEENCGACGAQCAAGLQCCGGRCVNTQTSNDHCSVCGRQCDAGWTCCGGGCVNTLNNVNHCGTCNNKCPGLLTTCNMGACGKILL